MFTNKSAVRRPNRPSSGEKNSKDRGFHFPGKFAERRKKRGKEERREIEAEKLKNA